MSEAHGGVGTRSHARSASHGGIMLTRDAGGGHGGAMPAAATGPAMAATADGSGGPGRGHQRTFSHGYLVEGGRGHRRMASKTEFILPAGYEQRERERERERAESGTGSGLKKGHTRQASHTDSVYTIRQNKPSLLRRLMFWKKGSEEGRTRLVRPNHEISAGDINPNEIFPDNSICTTKYTVLSFLPKNLFEQFHRFANLYFLFIVLLNFVPAVNAFGKEVAMLPLIFVLGITAIKDAFEDYRRYKSDLRVNNATCRVYTRDQNRYVKRLWSDVRVGDVIHLSCNEVIPADMVVLNSSDEHGICFIESSNLDGESNLKQRQSVKGLNLGLQEEFQVSQFNYMMEVGPPTTKMYHFTGTIPLSTGERVPLSKDNLLLRDCTLRNTDYIEGVVVYAGRETKAMLNNGGTRYKRSRLERRMNLEVIWCVVILFFMCLISATGSGLWQSQFEVNASQGLVPFLLPQATGAPLARARQLNSPVWVGFISFWTFIIIYQVIIPISLYVTIEVIKLMQVYHIHQDKDFEDKRSGKTIECRALNIPEELGQIEYVFTDKTGTLTENQMVFQCCSINDVDYSHTPIINTSSSSSSQGSNQQETFALNSQLQEELSAIELPLIYAQPRHHQPPAVPQNSPQERMIDFFLTLAACNTVVVAKHPHHDQMNASGMIVPSNSANSSEVDNASFTSIISNSWAPAKVLKGMWPFPRPLSPIAPSPRSTPPRTPESSPRYPESPSINIHMNPIPVQNPSHHSLDPMPEPSNTSPPRPTLLNIQPELSYQQLPSVTPPPLDIKPIYEAESPDELALVDAAYKYGFRLLRRSLHNILVSIPGLGLCEYEVLHVLPFDSNRKRMSIIVRHPHTYQKILYCKGADSAILDNLSRDVDEQTKLRVFRTQQHLNTYSKLGLRVLCMAKRVLSDSEYESWAAGHSVAENSLGGRERKLHDSYCRIEKNLSLLGATGIEDRLQDGVPETIQALRKAGIVVWVLTGDKQETAINIAYSCALFQPNMEIIKLNARTKDQAERTINFFLQQIQQQEELRELSQVNGECVPPGGQSSAPAKERGLVVDGRTLLYILDRRANLKKKFLSLAKQCSAVLCCRATPLQKALIVRSAKDSLKVLTLAVGDGANDVSMIQTADVGVGISGLEGRQAVMASDYAIARFRHLEKLLLVHGHWCYNRLARIILYFFYKNASFVLILLWYQLYNGFSGSSMIDQMYLMVFNLFFTSIPPIVVGIYDKDAPEEVLLAEPHLYSQGRTSSVYQPSSFWFNILDALYQSIILFFITALFYQERTTGMYEFGMTVTHACLLAQSLHIAIETKAWTVLHIGSLVASLLLFYIFGALYTATCRACMGSPSQYGELGHALATEVHWLAVILTSILAVLPRFVVRALQCSLNPDEVTQALLQHRSSRLMDFIVSWSASTSTSSTYRPGVRHKEGEEEEDVSDPYSSLVTTTTVVTTTDEAEV
ncbi:phospholipid-transporting ATPase VA-like isoform X2 [Portunus trituberculatus]|nr:phospholipid-transporting ATPase VA-like isoform X2 [Portunus trituberculatus]